MRTCVVFLVQAGSSCFFFGIQLSSFHFRLPFHCAVPLSLHLLMHGRSSGAFIVQQVWRTTCLEVLPLCPLSHGTVFDTISCGKRSWNSISSSQFGCKPFLNQSHLGSCLLFLFVQSISFPAICLLCPMRVAVKNDNTNTVVECRLLELTFWDNSVET